MQTAIGKALEAARLGLCVFPVNPLSAKPASPDWMEEATTDPTEISQWPPTSNYGIALGERSGGLFVVELYKTAGRHWWSARGLPKGLEVRSPGEAQVMYFGAPEGRRTTSVQVAEGVRIVGERGWTLGPGSVVPTGTVQARGSLGEIPVADFDPADLSSLDTLTDFLETANALPGRSSSGLDTARLLFTLPNDASDARRLRAALLRTAFEAGHGRMEAAAIAWGSGAGTELREDLDGKDRLWNEVEEAERLFGGASEPVQQASLSAPRLLLPREREMVEAHQWWGSRFAEWADQIALGHGARHRLNAWLVLSAYFSRGATMSRLGEGACLRLRAGLIDIGGADGADAPLRAVLRALSGSEVLVRRIPMRGYDRADRVDTNFEGVTRWLDDPRRRTAPPSVWAVEGEAVNVFPLTEAGGDFDPRAVRLATELDDAREALALVNGSASVSVSMSPEALARHEEFRSTIEALIADRRMLADFADSVRKCATLAALADGQVTVALRHEMVALLAAEEWLTNLERIMGTAQVTDILQVQDLGARILAGRS